MHKDSIDTLQNNKNEIEIKPIGSYLDIDEEGFIVNPASHEKIQEEWKPVIDDVIKAYSQAYGEHLRTIYIRGSVAKGQAIQHVSDIDTYAYIDLPKTEINEDWIDAAKKEITTQYPFVQGVEMEPGPISEFKEDTVVLNQSVCVYGDAPEVPKLKPGKDLAIHAPSSGFRKRILNFQEFYEAETTDEQVSKRCVSLMKSILRAGFEITMERSGKYTRDLYRCYEGFSEYYPDQEPQMREVLHLVLNPTTDKRKMKEIIDEFGMWLLDEVKKYF